MKRKTSGFAATISLSNETCGKDDINLLKQDVKIPAIKLMSNVRTWSGFCQLYNERYVYYKSASVDTAISGVSFAEIYSNYYILCKILQLLANLSTG